MLLPPRSRSFRVIVVSASLLAACAGPDADPAPMMPIPDLAAAVSTTPHALNAKIALMDDGMGVPLGTQNGSTVHVQKADLVGKFIYYATTPGGKSAANAKPIDFGVAKVGVDLTAMMTTGPKYLDGPWELAVFVSVTAGNPLMGPQPGDLAAFDLTQPPTGEPPVTGTTVRLHVHGADATVTLDNKYFIRF